MVSSATLILVLVHVGPFLACSGAEARQHTPSLGQQKWMKSYIELPGQTWFSLSYCRRDGAIYSSGKLQSTHRSDVTCLGSNADSADGEIRKVFVNGVICKMDSRSGQKNWCARTCVDGVPILSNVVTGGQLVFTSGITNSEDTIIYAVEKETGKQRMQVSIRGQVFKMDHNRDGVYTCGSGKDENGKHGMMVARVTTGGLKWHIVLREEGLETCLAINAPKHSFSAYVIGVSLGSSNTKRMYVMKLERETGAIQWKTELNDRNHVLTSGDIIVRTGVYVTSLEADEKSKRTHVLIHKLGKRTGLKLWSRYGKHAHGLHRSGFYGKRKLMYASYNESGVCISSTSSSSTAVLLGEAENEQQMWVQRQDEFMLKAVDTTLSSDGAVILWRSNGGSNLIQMESFNRAGEVEGKHGNVISRVKSKLDINLPSENAETVKAGICDVVADAMRGRAQIVNGLLMASGKVTKSEAEMIIKKIIEDRDNDGRSYVESLLGLRKRSVLLEGKLMTIEAREMHNQQAPRGRNGGTLSAQEESEDKKSVVAQSSSSSNGWTWWKVVLMTVGSVGLLGGVWLVARRV
ncbi:unnamed protein product [Agarophyton chilense]